MIKNIGEYISCVNNFENLSGSQLIDHFAYYLTKFKNQTTFKPKDIEQCFSELSIPVYSNISSYLTGKTKKIKGVQRYLRNKDMSYSLSRVVIEEINKNIILDVPKITVNNSLRGLALKLTNKSEQAFLEEAIKTFEAEAYKASIIMVWLLTIDHLYEYILSDKLSDFVIALKKVLPKKNLIIKDDFADLKESQFIEICRSSGIISNDVRKILDVKLGIRNSFAHPSNITLPKSKALDFIEDLIENVILKY